MIQRMPGDYTLAKHPLDLAIMLAKVSSYPKNYLIKHLNISRTSSALNYSSKS